MKILHTSLCIKKSRGLTEESGRKRGLIEVEEKCSVFNKEVRNTSKSN